MIEKKEFSEGDVVVRKKQAEDDNRKWLVIKVFKGMLWVKPIIGGIVIDDFLYKGVRKGKLKIVGHGKFVSSSAERQDKKLPFFVDEVIVLKEAINDIVSDPETKRRIYNRASELMERRKMENK